MLENSGGDVPCGEGGSSSGPRPGGSACCPAEDGRLLFLPRHRSWVTVVAGGGGARVLVCEDPMLDAGCVGEASDGEFAEGADPDAGEKSHRGVPTGCPTRPSGRRRHRSRSPRCHQVVSSQFTVGIEANVVDSQQDERQARQSCLVAVRHDAGAHYFEPRAPPRREASARSSPWDAACHGRGYRASHGPMGLARPRDGGRSMARPDRGGRAGPAASRSRQGDAAGYGINRSLCRSATCRTRRGPGRLGSGSLTRAVVAQAA